MVISQHKRENNTVEFSAFVAPGIFAMSRGCCVTYIEELRGVIRQLRGVEAKHVVFHVRASSDPI
jgi:hypothetical protein